MMAWRPEDDPNIRPPLQEGQVYRPDILDVIETSIDGLSEELRALSLDIHGNHRASISYYRSRIFERPSRAEV
jgi:hypothetical protein